MHWKLGKELSIVRLSGYSIGTDWNDITLSKKLFDSQWRSMGKNSNKDTIDVWQGSFDGGEVSEPISIFILSKINKTFHIDNYSLYSDDRLMDVSDNKKLEKKSFLSSSKIWTLK